MSANLWCRLWHDMPTDPKWRTIARSANQEISRVIAVFNFLMVEASMSERRGIVQPNAEDLATALDVSIIDIEAILTAMDGRVIETYETQCNAMKRDVTKRLSGWEKRQPNREDNSTGRVRELRERRQKELETQRNAMKRNETLDKDKDKDKDKEQKPLPKGKPSVDPRFGSFREDFEKAFLHSTGKPASWDVKEASQLSRWLKANPTVSREEWRTILQNRAKSPVNKASPLSKWVGSALAWLNGLADEWGKELPAEGKGRYGSREAKSEAAMRNLREALTGTGTPDDGSHRDGDPAGRSAGDGLFTDDGSPVIEGTLA